MSIVQYSASINSSFISTVDHLPSDVVRSLWLLQSLNLKIDKNRSGLHQLLLDAQTLKVDQEALREKYLQLEQIIRTLQLEAMQESKALYNQLVTHKWFLTEEVEQLNRINYKLANTDESNNHIKDLREKLQQHYKDNPLRSQREALKEQALKNSAPKSNGIGLKLLLKLSPTKLKKNPEPTFPKKELRQRPKNKINYNVLRPKLPNSSRDKILKAKLKESKMKKLKRQKEKELKAKQYQKVPEQAAPAPIEAQDDDNQAYCFCKQPSFGNMIACDNEESCPNGEWFHYKCVGLLNRVEALKYTTGKQKWFCSPECQSKYQNSVANKASVTGPAKKKTRKKKH